MLSRVVMNATPDAFSSPKRTALASVEVKQAWAGRIDMTPDLIPVISKVPSIKGLTIATGFSGHGFGLGPGAGRLGRGSSK